MAEKQKETDLNLLMFLESISLEQFHEVFLAQGVTMTNHLEDVGEKDAEMNFGMTKFQAKRLTREYSAWKARKSKEQTSQTFSNASQPEYNVSKSSVVIPMRTGFKTFFQTRDGHGNIVVPVNMLKNKFKSLWYGNPLNPFQQFSNTFILEMAEYRLQFEANLRSCELWCRKMRVERIHLLIACAQPSVISKWSTYYKKKSVEGMRQLARERYPEVVQILANYEEGRSTKISHLLYNSLCKYGEGLEQAQDLAKESVQKCETQITFCSQQKSQGKEILIKSRISNLNVHLSYFIGACRSLLIF